MLPFFVSVLEEDFGKSAQVDVILSKICSHQKILKRSLKFLSNLRPEGRHAAHVIIVRIAGLGLSVSIGLRA